MSKGSTRRPLKVPYEKYSENWDKIFGNKKENKEKAQQKKLESNAR